MQPNKSHEEDGQGNDGHRLAHFGSLLVLMLLCLIFFFPLR
jgi:hypothetical protein